jgi:hypothetical protein
VLVGPGRQTISPRVGSNTTTPSEPWGASLFFVALSTTLSLFRFLSLSLCAVRSFAWPSARRPRRTKLSCASTTCKPPSTPTRPAASGSTTAPPTRFVHKLPARLRAGVGWGGGGGWGVYDRAAARPLPATHRFLKRKRCSVQRAAVCELRTYLMPTLGLSCCVNWRPGVFRRSDCQTAGGSVRGLPRAFS